MPDVMTMFDPSPWLTALDLDGREVTVEIETVTPGEVVGTRGRVSRRPIVTFKGKAKSFAMNKTNVKIVIRMYTRKTEQWVGKLVTLYPTTTKSDEGIVDCIRVRPEIPKGKPHVQQRHTETTAPLTPDDIRAIELAEKEGAGA